jgi:hypothetical protein
MAAFAILVCIPQLLYWKYLTGNYFYYSYGDEKLLFTHPHVLQGLFGFRKGWLIYTPIMSFAVAGFFLIKKDNPWRNCIWIVTPIFIYIIYCWWCWWYGGSYGSRPMVDIYALLGIPFAACIQHVVKLKWYNVYLWSIIIFFISYNALQIMQYRTALLHYDSMTREAYFKILFRKEYPVNTPETFIPLLKKPDYDAAKRGEE